MTPKKQYPLAQEAAPPPPSQSGWIGYVKPFVAMLQENPDKWFQFRPGVAHDASRAERIRKALPGVVVTTRRWPKLPVLPHSRKRKKTTRCDIYALWPSVPGVVPPIPDPEFTEDDAAGMGVEAPPAYNIRNTHRAKGLLDEPVEPLDWSDFT